MNINDPPEATAFTSSVSNEAQQTEEKAIASYKVPSALVILLSSI